MEIYNKITDLPLEQTYGLTIGNFDGVHLGHQFLLSSVDGHCRASGLTMVVMTFKPHPLVVLKGYKGFLVNDDREKAFFLKSAGVDHLVELSFDREFSTLPPEDFLRNHVLSNRNVKKLYLGYDFSFGANKQGDHKFVKDFCLNLDIDVHVLGEHDLGDRKYSSSQVRAFLESGDAHRVKEVLGRYYSLSGIVVKGEGRGRGLGFATANLGFSEQKKVPKGGVYATETLVNGSKYLSITNIGTNPTFSSKLSNNIVETHLLDFDRQIYGQSLNVIFLKRIRDEVKFSSSDQLIAQIKKDIAWRRAYEY